MRRVANGEAGNVRHFEAAASLTRRDRDRDRDAIAIAIDIGRQHTHDGDGDKRIAGADTTS